MQSPLACLAADVLGAAVGVLGAEGYLGLVLHSVTGLDLAQGTGIDLAQLEVRAACVRRLAPGQAGRCLCR